MSQLLQSGQRLAGYEIGELIGRGGMGEVYRARQLSMDRVVALKILAPRLAKSDPRFAERFVDEARAAGRLNHPNIIAVHDVGRVPMPGAAPGSEPDLEYFSMEYVDGESMKEALERGPCSLAVITRVMLGMCEALVYAEAHGVVHRDIKPDNIMITQQGVVKLADLGLALQLSDERIAVEKDAQGRAKVMGTPLYMSPEQARALPVDGRSDQYSLGATLYHLLTGEPPYEGDNAKAIMRAQVFAQVPDPWAIAPEIPAPWRALTMRLLAKDPAQRFASAVALRQAVQDVCAGRGQVSVPVATSGTPWRWWLAGAGVLLLVVVVAGWWWLAAQTPAPVVNTTSAVQESTTALIAQLPVEHAAALTLLASALEQPQWSPAAREELRREQTIRESAVQAAQQAAAEQRQEQLRQQRKQLLASLEEAAAADDLARLQQTLHHLQAQRELLSPLSRQRYDELAQYVLRKENERYQLWTQKITAATTRAQLRTYQTALASELLNDQQRRALTESIRQRRKELAANAPTTAPTTGDTTTTD